MSVLYWPAGLNIAVAIAWGRPGIAGIFLGSALTNFFARGVSIIDSLFLAIPTCAALALAVRPIGYLSASAKGWANPKPRSIFFSAVIYSLLNPIFHHAVFWWLLPTEEFSLSSMLIMAAGDFLGIILVFAVATLLSAAWLRLRTLK